MDGLLPDGADHEDRDEDSEQVECHGRRGESAPKVSAVSRGETGSNGPTWSISEIQA